MWVFSSSCWKMAKSQIIPSQEERVAEIICELLAMQKRHPHRGCRQVSLKGTQAHPCSESALGSWTAALQGSGDSWGHLYGAFQFWQGWWEAAGIAKTSEELCDCSIVCLWQYCVSVLTRGGMGIPLQSPSPCAFFPSPRVREAETLPRYKGGSLTRGEGEVAEPSVQVGAGGQIWRHSMVLKYL